MRMEGSSEIMKKIIRDRYSGISIQGKVGAISLEITYKFLYYHSVQCQ